MQGRPGSDAAAWRRLDQELEAAGIDVYFARGGVASWEVRISTGELAEDSSIGDPALRQAADGALRLP